MKLGKILWSIILIKLAVVFLVLKIFFFPFADHSSVCSAIGEDGVMG